MVLSVGYKFSHKKWLAAFAMSFSLAAQGAQEPEKYELLDLPSVERHIEEAKQAGDEASASVYEMSRRALQETADGLRGTPNDLPADFDKKLYAHDNTGVEYKVINPDADVDWTEFYCAQKTTPVKAEKVEPGTVVETIMANGLVESTKTAGSEGGYRVTNPTGEQYLVDTAKFEKLYDAAEGADGIFKPKPSIRKVVDISQNVAFTAPWGYPMYIREGGVLVHEKVGKVYGIQPDEYAATYSKV